ncbi:MAG TPA: hypothetical protein PK228_15905 [Saprospiraceae bacterium]|nr:hypothetical protein [Saprospiraceae bacterium]
MLTIQDVPAPPKFKVTQQRKPWSAAAAWVLMQAEFLAGPENPEVLQSVEQLAQRLRDTLQFKAERDGDIRRGLKGIEIKTWSPQKGRVVCGIDKPNSTNGSAFYISLEETQ